MTALVSMFWRICLFKSGPDVIPANNFLLGLLIAGNGLISWSASMLLQAMLPISPEVTNQVGQQEIAMLSDSWVVLSRVIVSLATTAALVWGILQLTNFADRTSKVLCAVFGTDIILTVFTVAAVIIGQFIHPLLGQFTILAMFFWTVAILGFILHRALAISQGLGIAAGAFILLFSFAITQVALGA
jgi:hypothetical protein